ncbi:hypothetical protein CTRI78_v005164 [Colletotrichum trifolii]|uniref:Mtf2-like C-terminal domain-containing protein n=1 Tax=Colletotrichum trifolii TaxID=5466 RepID=A0A4R8RFE9_COLTR|nr:hypothetical protein CTRI78_v005164 [Colletotrichum trifolii]
MIPFEWEGPVPDEPVDDIPSGQDEDTTIKSTITPSERHVFRKIFDDLSRRGSLAKRAPPPEFFDDDAAAEAEATSQESTREAILSRFPPSLRRAAEVAMGMRDEQQDHPTSRFRSRSPLKRDEAPELDEAAQELESMRQQIHMFQSAHLQKLIDECVTDAEVWVVLEREVFSMVEKLGIAQPQSRDAEVDTEAQETGETVATLNMDTHGPIYSSHLLLGLKALDNNFAQSSPLALNVLPRVKELGLASYVLGVSTPFYNQLASIFWHRYGDTMAVSAVLDEMQHAGLYYDRQTQELVDAIEADLESFRDGKLGVFSNIVGTDSGYNLQVKVTFARHARRIRHSIRFREGKRQRK